MPAPIAAQRATSAKKGAPTVPLNLHHRDFANLLDFTPLEIKHLLKLARDLKAAKYGGYERPQLTGKNIALIFEKTSTRTRCAFEIAAHDQGAHVTYLARTSRRSATRSRCGTRPAC